MTTMLRSEQIAKANKIPGSVSDNYQQLRNKLTDLMTDLNARKIIVAADLQHNADFPGLVDPEVVTDAENLRDWIISLETALAAAPRK